MTPEPPESDRLYTRFLSIAKTLQIIIPLLVVSIVMFLLASVRVVGTSVPLSLILIPFLLIVILVGVIYFVTQALIAIVDLLSRIEQNSRPE